MNKNELINDIVGKLAILESITPEGHVTVEQVRKQRSLWDSSLNTPAPQWKAKPGKYLAPYVLDLDGKMKRADELIKQYVGDGKIFANDSINPVTGGGLPLNQLQFNKLNQLLIDNYFIGYGELSLLTQNGLLNKICQVTSEEMCRKWIEFKSIGGDVDEDKLAALEAEFDRLGVHELFEWSAYLTFVFGGCQQYVKLVGDEYYQEDELLIDSSTINVGDVEHIGVIEPTWYVPIQFNTTEPRNKWFYEPELYVILGKITHATRLFKMMYNKCVNLLKPVYLFNGIPLMQQCIPWVTKFEITYNNIVTIVNRYNLAVLKTNMESIIDDSLTNDVEYAATNFKNRIQIFNTFRDNLSTLALAKDEEFEQVQMSLAGLRELLDKSLELIAVIPGFPITKLFGSSPAGMNATGEFEMQNWYDHLHSLQEKMFRPNLTKFMHIAMLNIWGEIDEDITFDFVKLQETNPLEDAQIELVEAQTDAQYAEMMVLSPQEIKTALINDPDSRYNELESEEIDIDNMISQQDFGAEADNESDEIIK